MTVIILIEISAIILLLEMTEVNTNFALGLVIYTHCELHRGGSFLLVELFTGRGLGVLPSIIDGRRNIRLVIFMTTPA